MSFAKDEENLRNSSSDENMNVVEVQEDDEQFRKE